MCFSCPLPLDRGQDAGGRREKGESGEGRGWGVGSPAHVKAEVKKNTNPAILPAPPLKSRLLRAKSKSASDPDPAGSGCSQSGSRQGARVPSWPELAAAAVSLAAGVGVGQTLPRPARKQKSIGEADL